MTLVKRASRLDRRSKVPPMTRKAEIELVAAIVSIADNEPVVEMIASQSGDGVDRLPSVPFAPGEFSSLQQCLRTPVEQQTGHSLGHLQQVTAFVDPDNPERVMLGYLALVHDTHRGRRLAGASRRRTHPSRRQGCYLHLPWEDWRAGRPRLIDELIVPQLQHWAGSTVAEKGKGRPSKAAAARQLAERMARIRLAFAGPAADWDATKVAVRFEILVEAGMIAEEVASNPPRPTVGRPMTPGHRRILAAALAQLRADLTARPVVFELMDEEFSLYDLQRTVEIILGPNLHKQNFRRQIETARLVEPTGGIKSHTGGRPAKLYRFRRDVLLERPRRSQ